MFMNTPNFIFMQLIGNQTEWAKAYALLHIINEGNIYFYKDNFQNEYSFYPVSKLIRNDECGKITYQLTPTEVLVRRGEETQRMPRIKCKNAATEILSTLQETKESDYSVSNCDPILETLHYTWFQSTADDKSDFSVIYFDPEKEIAQRQEITVCIKSKWNILPANRANNLKYDIQNVKFSNPESNRINRIDGAQEVQQRLTEIYRLGGKLKYTTAENKFFLENLCMIDLHFQKLLAEITRLFYTTGLSAIPEIITEIKNTNPYKIKEELIYKNNFYEYKVQQFLYALATGLRSTKRYRGYGHTRTFAIIDTCGEIELLDSTKRTEFDRYLYQNAKLSMGNSKTHKFGFVEKENGQWFIKLNIEIII